MKNRKKIIGLVLARSMLMQVNSSSAHPCVSPVGALFVLGAIGGGICLVAAGVVGAATFVGYKVVKHVFPSDPEKQRKREELKAERKRKREARRAERKKKRAAKIKSKKPADKKTDILSPA